MRIHPPPSLRRSLPSLATLALLVLAAGSAGAAGLGDRCETGSNVAQQYLCPFGTLCLKSISNKYCSQADKQCGWHNTNGYHLGAKKTYNGQQYVCTATGFVKDTSSGGSSAPAPGAGVGDECKTGLDVAAQYLCGSGTICLQAIGKKYCSHADKQCGWPGEAGYLLGQQKSYGGDQYVCAPTGFQKLASNDEPSAVVVVPGVTKLPVTPLVRTLKTEERTLLSSVYGRSINFSMVRVTNTEGGADGAPWTTNTPPLYTVNVGANCYVSFERDDCRNGHGLGTLVHELGHVWQGQHGVPFMTNSLYHQGKAIYESGDRNRAYDFEPGAQWNTYNAEQQAEIIESWYEAGQSTSHALYPYIRDNVRPGRPNATTSLPSRKRARTSTRGSGGQR